MTTGPRDARQTARQLGYADGSGNAYVLEGALLRYLPVTPATSSSGTYSGGAPFEKTLSPQELSDLTRALDAAAAAKGSHVEHRVMMSGLVTLGDGAERQSFVLAPGCAEQKDVEAVLQRLKPAPKD